MKLKLIAILVAFIATGCEKAIREEQNAGLGDSAKSTFSALSDDSILIRADDKHLDKKDVQQLIELRREIIKLAAPDGVRIEDVQLAAVEGQVLFAVTNMYLREIALLKYAQEHDLTASKEDISACRQGFSSSINKTYAKWDKVLKMFPESLISTINDRVEKEATIRAVQRDFLSKTDICATQEEIDDYFNRYLSYNLECAKTNSLIWNVASNVFDQLTRGADFSTLADKYDEDEDKTDDHNWGEFRVDDLQDEIAVWQCRNDFKKGWISPPIESDNGLVVLKIDAVIEDGEEIMENDYIPTPNTEYRFLRIFFHLPLFLENVSKEDFASQANTVKQMKGFEDMVKDLIHKLDVSYPSGLDIFSAPESNEQEMLL